MDLRDSMLGLLTCHRVQDIVQKRFQTPSTLFPPFTPHSLRNHTASPAVGGTPGNGIFSSCQRWAKCLTSTGQVSDLYKPSANSPCSTVAANMLHGIFTAFITCAYNVVATFRSDCFKQMISAQAPGAKRH